MGQRMQEWLQRRAAGVEHRIADQLMKELLVGQLNTFG
jgi:hypothetical protein